MSLWYTINPIAFYVPEIAKTIPSGAKELSKDEADALFSAQAQGKRFVVVDDHIEAVDPPPPPPPQPRTQIPPLEFFARFTDDEEMALATAATQNPRILLWFTKASAATIIDLTSDTTKAGVQALVEADIIAQDRADEILVPIV